MFDEQTKNNGVEDILAATEPAAGPMVPPGPPSALAGGKLQPVQSGGREPAVPLEQMSSAGHSSFSIKKIIASAVVVLAVGGGATAGYFWWQGRTGGSSLPPTTVPLGQPNNEPAATTAAAENSAPTNNPLNQALDNLQQDAINKAVDPFAQPAAPAPGNVDTDGDGLNDADEATYGTNPRLLDTDGDGLSDWEEVTVFGANPLNPDTDSDTYPDGAEVQKGYNPKGPGKLLDFEKAKTQAQ